MAFSCSTSFTTPPISIKWIPHVPQSCELKSKSVLKPKKSNPKSKAKFMATTTAEHSCSGADPKEASGEERFTVNDEFTLPDSNTSLPTLCETADAVCSMDSGLLNAFAEFPDASGLQDPEPDNPGELLDDGWPNHTARVAEGDPNMRGLLGGTIQEHAPIVEDDTADELHCTMSVEPSIASDRQDCEYPPFAGNAQYAAVHWYRGGFIEGIESVQSSSQQAQDEPLFSETEVADRPSTTHKRARLDALNLTPEPELENPRLTKRREPVTRLAESPIRSLVLTPKPTTRSGVSHSRASSERSLISFESDDIRGDTRTTCLSPSNFHSEDNGSHSAQSCWASQRLLHSSRGDIGPCEGESTEGLSGRFEERQNDVDRYNELLPAHTREASAASTVKRLIARHKEVAPEQLLGNCQIRKQTSIPRSSVKTSRRRTCSDRLLQKEKTSPRSRPLYCSPMGNRPRSSSPRALSLGTRAETKTKYRPAVESSYHMTDFTLCAVPRGSSIVTAVVHYGDTKRPLDQTTLGARLLGGNGKVIRMTQLSPDSWMLLGYWYDDDASGLCTGRIPKTDWASETHSDDSSDDDWDEESEKREEGTKTCGKRTRKPWLESDEMLLLSLKDKQGMDWKEICKRFPDRTPPAVQVRYYMLHKKDNSSSTGLMGRS